MTDRVFAMAFLLFCLSCGAVIRSNWFAVPAFFFLSVMTVCWLHARALERAHEFGFVREARRHQEDAA